MKKKRITLIDFLKDTLLETLTSQVKKHSAYEIVVDTQKMELIIRKK